MDRPIDPRECLPTALHATSQRQERGQCQQALLDDLVAKTKDVLEAPYNADNWLTRALVLEGLGYPELAVGDACKVQMLCDWILPKIDKPECILGSQMGFWMDSLESERWQPELSILRLRTKSKLHRLKAFADELMGRNRIFRPRPYPWLDGQHRTRADAVLDSWNAEFRANMGTVSRRPCCRVGRGAFSKHPESEGGREDIGVFALRDILKHELLVRDRTQLLEASHDDGTGCCELTCAGCRDSRMQADTGAPYLVLLVQCLRRSRTDGASHPLEHALLARLRPHYRSGDEQIIIPEDVALQNRSLLRLGIDIFTDLNVDTWVLYTIQARLANNAWTGLDRAGLHSLFAAFNHSCEPNVAWQLDHDRVTLDIRAVRDISAEEQLFVTYDTWLDGKPLEARRVELLHWLDGPCQCSRCLREEEHMVDSPHAVVDLDRFA